MPMKALFQCDRCGAKKSLQGNINLAWDYMTKKGWSLGKEVLCDACSPAKPAGATEAASSKKVRTEVCSDGSCVGGNPGYGGWGWATATTSDSGPAAEYPSTNQRMEIKAAAEALKNNADPVLLYSDSQYVVNCLTKKWYLGWQRKGWKNAKGDPVANRDLWEELVAQLPKHPRLEVKWVKGHQDHPLNIRADEAARSASEALREKMKGKKK